MTWHHEKAFHFTPLLRNIILAKCQYRPEWPIILRMTWCYVDAEHPWATPTMCNLMIFIISFLLYIYIYIGLLYFIHSDSIYKLSQIICILYLHLCTLDIYDYTMNLTSMTCIFITFAAFWTRLKRWMDAVDAVFQRALSEVWHAVGRPSERAKHLPKTKGFQRFVCWRPTRCQSSSSGRCK